MKLNKLTLLFLFLTISLSCKKNNEDEIKTITHTDSNGFTYQTVTNDPTGLRLYTLDNGMKVYLSQNTDEPKIQTFIPIRAGSTYDPSDNTGLAHYLEHMVFKGTDQIGTQDFEKEKQYLDKIKQLYEDHKAETDIVKKKDIYKEIDKVSQEASKISIANEYDKMVGSLGAQGTNAWTWHEETVYVNKIPANELNKWLILESERFSQLVLRLFHTELEAVYEEFNRAQDNDFRKAHYAMMDALFPTHPYGQQTTIGVSEHLKNPSMVAIHNYFDTYYVPNNMAVILVGDLEFEKTIQEINDTFGKFEYKEVTHPSRPTETDLNRMVTKDVYGPEAARVSLAFRSKGIGTKEEKLLTMVDMILSNSEAGLIDLNLNQKQMVQSAGCSPSFFNDYGYHRFYATPKSGQTLDEAQALLLEQIENVKQGKFDDWLLEAVINDLKLSEIKNFENSSSVAYQYVKAFTQFQDWENRIKFLDDLRSITKQELVDFANSFYGNNYVVVNKHQGEARTLVKVDKPEITPIELNRGKKSNFYEQFSAIESPNLEPKFVDYTKAIKKSKTQSGLDVSFIENKLNDLAELYVIFDMGKDHDKKLSTAVGYLEYLGTDKYTPEALKKEFYKIGVQYGVNSGNDRSYVYLRGLRENLDKGLELLEHLWDNAVSDQETYIKYVEKIGKTRQDTKANKGEILWNGLLNYGLYGEESRLRDIYTLSELNNINPEELVDIVKNLKQYKHRIFYYGKDLNQAITALDHKHIINDNLLDYPDKKLYVQKETGDNVYYTNYDMVQAQMLLIAKGEEFDETKLAASRLFNTYFGSGLSSVVFQELRESKALAYSAFSAYTNAQEVGKSNYVYSFIGTQANKMTQAVEAMIDLMTNMPEAQEQFVSAKEATLKKIAAQRINKTNLFWNYERLKKRGIDNDNREDIYNIIQNMTLDDLKTFFNENIKGEKYNILVIGNEKDLDLNALSKLGRVQKMDVDYLFNFEKPKEVKL